MSAAGRKRKPLPAPTSFICPDCGVTMIVQTDGPFGREIIHEGKRLFVYGRSRPVHPPIPCIRPTEIAMPDDDSSLEERAAFTGSRRRRFVNMAAKKNCIQCGGEFVINSFEGARKLCHDPKCKEKQEAETRARRNRYQMRIYRARKARRSA